MITRGKLYFSDSGPITRDAAIETAVAQLPHVGIAGATIYETQGVWNGEVEFGFVLETLNPAEETFLSLKSQLEEVAELLRAQYNQTSVLVTVETVDGDMVFVEESNK
jgi:hypothetical protein